MMSSATCAPAAARRASSPTLASSTTRRRGSRICARNYDPATGRFTARDIVQPNADGTQGYNRYAYVANNPCLLTDPSGHYAICDRIAQAAKMITIYAAIAILIGLVYAIMRNPIAKNYLIFGARALATAFYLFAMAFLCIRFANRFYESDPTETTNEDMPSGPAGLRHASSSYPTIPGIAAQIQ
jgi:RHS repeat-associated protein